MPPLVGEYEGPGRPPQAEPKGEWFPAKLELLADGGAWWFCALELEGFASIGTLKGCWRVDSPTPDIEVVTVLPGGVDGLPVSFEVTTEAGETVLVAEDGTRMRRVR